MSDRELYVIEVTRPEGVSVTEMEAFIQDAVNSWGGQFHPDHPLFDSHRPVKIEKLPLRYRI